MTTKSSKQGKPEFCVALMNRFLHGNSICPGNHDVNYSHGWFYIDDDGPCHRPDLTEEADQIMAEDRMMVGYSPVWNTYVLIQNPDFVEVDSYDAY